MSSRFPWGVTKCPLCVNEFCEEYELLERDASGTEYSAGGGVGVGFLGAEYNVGGRVGVGFGGTEYNVGGRVGVGFFGAEYSVGGRIGVGFFSVFAIKMTYCKT